MDNILLCSNHIPLVTSIHNTFIEKYMLHANGSYVKVYLYLSKCIQAGEEDLSISSLADQMENTEKDVIRALNYWEKQGLMRLTRGEDGEEILGIDVLNPDETLSAQEESRSFADLSAGNGDTTGTSAKRSSSNKDTHSSLEGAASDSHSATDASTDNDAKASEQKPEHSKTTAASKTQTASPSISTVEARPKSSHKTIQVTTEQMNRLAENDDFCWTSNVVESYLGRPVKPKELQLITYLYDTLHFSSELILHLYEYCISLGKTSTSYIEKVAIAWDEKQVKTPDDAQNATIEYNTTYNAVSKAMALGRPLAAIEKDFVDRWQNQWSMDLSVILEACNRTLLKLQHGDFKYAEAIVERWHRSGVHTLADIQKADEAFANEKAMERAAKRNGSDSGTVQHKRSQAETAALERQLLQV
ncbi:MAG: hypothetical protein BHW06_06785 [Clostridium sp. 44_14]|nr:MAG: hypothetical protein BHW06_06785 [Clostridium sp. 44_14]